MKHSTVLQEVRKMRFAESYEGWKEGRLTQEEAVIFLRSLRQDISAVFDEA